MDEILADREWRVRRRTEIQEKLKTPLICFSMNIPGPEKNAPLIEEAFQIGLEMLATQLSVAGIRIGFTDKHSKPTGCVAFYGVEGDPRRIKELTTEIEEASPLGRLFDMDVLDEQGQKLERSIERRCLLCESSARVCGRSRAHGLEALVSRTREILQDGVWTYRSQKVAAQAARALLYEVCTTPKPGLVDRRNSGSHADMDIFTFMDSVPVLQPYFARCARIGMEAASLSPEETFDKLRYPGRMAEGDMRRATGGVNTHKGAIFCLGILCAALGRLEPDLWKVPERVAEECAAMTKGLTERELAGVTAESARTAGERIYAAHGVTGIRGQVEAGFPAVLNTGLPVLEQGVSRKRSLERAGSAVLLALMTAAVDTNMVARSDYETARRMSREMALLLARDMYPDEEKLLILDELFRENNLSPGGSADLLAVTYFLYFLKNAD